MKKRFFLLAVLTATVMLASSQSGSNCSNAIPISTNNNGNNKVILTGPETWFTFTSRQNALDFTIQSAKKKSVGGIEKIEVLAGTCNSFIKVAESKSNMDQQVISVKTNKLQNGYVYYVKIMRKKSVGPIEISISQKSSGGGGGNHSLFLCANGTVQAAGSNSAGQLGNGTTGGSSASPVNVSNLTNVIAVAAGGSHSLALLSNGNVMSWGFNGYGQLGNNTTTDSNVPVSVSGLTNIIQISAGDNFSIALKNDGTVWAWGDNVIGQLGDGTNINSSVPVQVSLLNGIVDIEAGAWHAMAVKSDGTVWAWGQNTDGQYGTGNTNSWYVPVQSTTTVTATTVSAGDDFSVIIDSNGDVYATGNNSLGQLGNNSTASSLSFIPSTSVNAISGNMMQVSCGNQHTLALRNDRTVWSWGQNFTGQLGNGTTSSTPYLSVVQATGLTCVHEISAGWQFSIASLMNGTVYTWGINFIGQLGDGSTTDKHSPNANGACNRLNPLSIAGTNTICIGGNTSLTASGGIGPYSWAPSSSLSTATGTVVTASPTVTTTYTVTDMSGCNTATFTLNVNNPVVSVNSATICTVGSVTLTASGASTYTWSPATGLSATTGSTVIASPTSTTVYTITGTDAFGCTDIATATVAVGGNFTAYAGPDEIVCEGGSVQLNATGGVSYSWQSTSGLNNPNISNPVAGPLYTSITYTVTVTDAYGCTDTDDMNIQVQQGVSGIYGLLHTTPVRSVVIDPITGSIQQVITVFPNLSVGNILRGCSTYDPNNYMYIFQGLESNGMNHYYLDVTTGTFTQNQVTNNIYEYEYNPSGNNLFGLKVSGGIVTGLVTVDPATGNALASVLSPNLSLYLTLESSTLDLNNNVYYYIAHDQVNGGNFYLVVMDITNMTVTEILVGYRYGNLEYDEATDRLYGYDQYAGPPSVVEIDPFTGATIGVMGSLSSNLINCQASTAGPFNYYLIGYDVGTGLNNHYWVDLVNTGANLTAWQDDIQEYQYANCAPVCPTCRFMQPGASDLSSVVKDNIDNHPNPSSTFTQFDFSVANPGLVTVQVFNISGELIATPINEFKETGNYSIRINIENLAAGVYVYKMQTALGEINKKMIVTK